MNNNPLIQSDINHKIVLAIWYWPEVKVAVLEFEDEVFVEWDMADDLMVEMNGRKEFESMKQKDPNVFSASVADYCSIDVGVVRRELLYRCIWAQTWANNTDASQFDAPAECWHYGYLGVAQQYDLVIREGNGSLDHLNTVIQIDAPNAFWKHLGAADTDEICRLQESLSHTFKSNLINHLAGVSGKTYG